MKKNIAIGVLLGIVLLSFPSYFDPLYQYKHSLEAEAAESFNGTIYLVGNAALIVGINKITSGDGSQQNPFLISDLVISPPNNQNGIVIKNTSKFIKIQDVTINGGLFGISMENVSNVTVENVTIRNTADSGIVFLGANNITINGVNIKNVPQRGIYTNSRANADKNYNVAITNSTIENTGETSIMVYGENNLIANNHIINSHWRSIVILSPFVNTAVVNNIIEGSAMEAIYVFGKDVGWIPERGKTDKAAQRIFIINNEITNGHEDHIEMSHGVFNAVVSYNYIHDNLIANSINVGHMNSIELWRNVANVEVRHNVIANNGGNPSAYANGILVANAFNNNIRDNTVTNVPGYAVMLLYDDSTSTFTQGNVITGNKAFNTGANFELNRVDNRNLANFNTIIF